MDWDPFQYVDEEAELTAEELRARIVAHARTLDPAVAVCEACEAPTRDWVLRDGVTGKGFCRACTNTKAPENAHARSVVQRFQEGLQRLLRLREERKEKIAKEIQDVPF